MSVSGEEAMALGELAERWTEGIDAALPAAVALRHELHANPDVSGQEEPTARRVMAALGGLDAETVAGTGRLVRLGPPGPSIGLRAELDALPVAELTGSPFASTVRTPPAMHACGHDVHLAGLFAVLQAARRLKLPLGLIGLLQPREEVGPTGAADVVAGDHLVHHQVRALVAAHVQPQVPAGRVASDAGPVNAAVDEIEIVVSGRGGHGAYPHLAVDPVPALCRIVLALSETARSTVNPLHASVVSITQISGSAAPNVIPGTAAAAGTIRLMHETDRPLLHERLARTVTSIAEAHGCTGKYEVRRGEPALVNDATLAGLTRGWLDEFRVPTASFASCGSDDFATYGSQVPILMQFVGTGYDHASGPMLHDPSFLPGDEVVRQVAVALLAGWLGAASVTSPSS
ncbi:M20 metallopeptidase family protein [Kineosporia succinea]|uniref:Amidohydrolase n=1 Tax=Kineosporia succinea TaxID=84632 RepID=A0ABT9P1A8_9ACTN|nr:amidohydrolase [Kineosporia succinea]MDP9826351.1 amidohydrolase [Kineosporia succinea]